MELSHLYFLAHEAMSGAGSNSLIHHFLAAEKGGITDQARKIFLVVSGYGD